MYAPDNSTVIAYGGYRMVIEHRENFEIVRVYDLGNLRFPLMWSKQMSAEDAQKAAQRFFNDTGYYNITED